ncbi:MULTISPECIES: type II secretion system protein GspM [unclassified Halorhodospira]|uniref:type II secretion system protein GspM n=1 Tax=unclassified Halorhodospira TaxID=2626748 RepID=UPI001EE8FEE3|nr:MULTISPECIES: type II secretion system protein GspM [unclassified Halorhodospira]MCG5540447.1 type II secretion system protein M [Halorhodospira sp. M39old]MCG5545700.1 type II secretion system protein M [Halorhodospira sp. M38]
MKRALARSPVVAQVTGAWDRLNQALWQRTVRERVLVGVALFAVIAALWYFYLHEPQRQALEQARSSAENAENQLPQLRAQIEELEAERDADPDEAIEREIASLEEELEAVQRRMAEDMPDFIEPGDMRGVLEALLARRDDTELRAFERLPAEVAMEAEDENGETLKAYRHPVRMVFEGDYEATLRLLEEVENLQWQFAWEELTYEVEEYPLGRVEVRLHTLSGHEAWLDL